MMMTMTKMVVREYVLEHYKQYQQEHNMYQVIFLAAVAATAYTNGLSFVLN